MIIVDVLACIVLALLVIAIVVGMVATFWESPEDFIGPIIISAVVFSIFWILFRYVPTKDMRQPPTVEAEQRNGYNPTED